MCLGLVRGLFCGMSAAAPKAGRGLSDPPEQALVVVVNLQPGSSARVVLLLNH